MDRAADVTGVAASDIECLAQQYASLSPAVIRCGWGPERNRNGGKAVAAILAMPALLGKFGVRGGGYTMSNNGAMRIRVNEALGDLRWESRTINMSQLGAVLNGSVDPPVKGLFVYNCNPVATVPDQNAVIRGLLREDLFTVVFDQVLTDSAEYADILLPATTFLEHDDISISYGTYVAGGATPVISPCGEARPNADVFAALGRDMKFDDEPFRWTSDSYVRHAAAHLEIGPRPGDHEVFARGDVQRCDFNGGDPVQFETVMPLTADKKIDLAPDALGATPYGFDPVESARYPLALITPATPRMVSSTLGEFNYDELVATLHPDDAAARNVSDGDVVRIFNDLGEVICRAEVRSAVRSGEHRLMKKQWFLLLAFAGFFTTTTPAVGQTTPTTIVLVRHAEKGGEPGDRDPELNDAGRRRAAALARVLGDANISTIYSTPFLRTRNTAAPLARRLGIEVTITPITPEFIEDMAATLRSEHSGETVVVVGHSNTVPQTINALGAGPMENLADDEYDWLFVVTLAANGSVSLMELRYGQ